MFTKLDREHNKLIAKHEQAVKDHKRLEKNSNSKLEQAMQNLKKQQDDIVKPMISEMVALKED